MKRTRVYGVWSTSVSVSYFIRRRQEASAMQGPMTEHGRFQGSGLLWLTTMRHAYGRVWWSLIM